jgi:predicted phage-related endonuclease
MGITPSKTPAEMLKENKNAIRTSIREIDREQRQLERRKKEVESKIKKCAKENRIVLLISFFTI